MDFNSFGKRFKATRQWYCSCRIEGENLREATIYLNLVFNKPIPEEHNKNESSFSATIHSQDPQPEFVLQEHLTKHHGVDFRSTSR